MDLLERVGAYAGLAAFLGLAVLALLYFSQARDVRRLREWAGRAPERSGEIGATQHYLPPTPVEAVPKPRKPLLQRIGAIHVPRARYLALVAGGVVILVAATLGALHLINNGDGSSGSAAGNAATQATGTSRGKGGSGSVASKINPGDVTVAVLNGTQVAGLASQVGEEARSDGFTLGTVTNAARTDQARSQVLFRKGQQKAARAVGVRLRIRSIGPVDPLTAELAGSFDVVVLVGADRSG